MAVASAGRLRSEGRMQAWAEGGCMCGAARHMTRAPRSHGHEGTEAHVSVSNATCCCVAVVPVALLGVTKGACV
jgi:hypothetical protein